MKPIIFSTDMVKAIMGGRKTQTRRVIQPQPIGAVKYGNFRVVGDQIPTVILTATQRIEPRYQPMDTLWVREAWCECTTNIWPGDANLYAYCADYCTPSKVPWKWRPSIHMPREAARLFLFVTDVRVERVRDIYVDDAIAEGVWGYGRYPDHSQEFPDLPQAAAAFAHLWDSLNAKRGHSWESNPWVWAYSFERISEEEAKRG